MSIKKTEFAWPIAYWDEHAEDGSEWTTLDDLNALRDAVEMRIDQCDCKAEALHAVEGMSFHEDAWEPQSAFYDFNCRDTYEEHTFDRADELNHKINALLKEHWIQGNSNIGAEICSKAVTAGLDVKAMVAHLDD